MAQKLVEVPLQPSRVAWKGKKLDAFIQVVPPARTKTYLAIFLGFDNFAQNRFGESQETFLSIMHTKRADGLDHLLLTLIPFRQVLNEIFQRRKNWTGIISMLPLGAKLDKLYRNGVRR
jgi:hypothetical protein